MNGEKDRPMRVLDVITSILLIVGGLNWLVVGVTAGRFDFVMRTIGRPTEYLAYIVYLLVGLCAVYQAVLWRRIRVAYWRAHPMARPEEGEHREPAIQP